jgi:ribonucleotide monophosphatase NagD (HAD superfamily)
MTEFPSGVIFDLDGVLENDLGLETDAIELWEFLSRQSIPTVVLTNDIRPSCLTRISQLVEWGLRISRRHFLTPYDALRLACTELGLSKPRLFGTPPPNEFVISNGGGSYDCVVLSDVSTSLADLATCVEMVQAGLPLFALQKNPFLPGGRGTQADVGYHIAAWEYCLGRKAEVLGKPGRFAYLAALEILGCPPERVLMISDSCRIDLMGAAAVGIQGALIAKYAGKSEGSMADGRFEIHKDLSAALSCLVLGCE